MMLPLSLPSQSFVPESVWQEGHAFIDHLKAAYEGLRREQQNLYNHLAIVQDDLHQQALRITALEAKDTSPTAGLPQERLSQISLLAYQVRQRHGYRIAQIFAGLADHFRVEDVSDLPERDWPAVLQWFASLLEE